MAKIIIQLPIVQCEIILEYFMLSIFDFFRTLPQSTFHLLLEIIKNLCETSVNLFGHTQFCLGELEHFAEVEIN